MSNHRSPSEAFGLVAWLEKTRVILPLKGVECRFAVTAGLASVEIDQVYLQENPHALDCIYSFPLPCDAAVHRCEMHVNGRLVRAIVRKHDEANDLYEEARRKGHRAILVEAERDNLFTINLGNVQSGDLVVVRFAYVEKLDRHSSKRRLRIPFCPGVRYIPGRPLLRSPSGRGTADDTDEVPDGSRISPPRIDELHPDAAYLSITGMLALNAAAAQTLESRTHDLVFSPEESAWRARLADKASVPDRDFVVAWRESVATALEARAWGVSTGSGACARVQLRAPKAAVARPPMDFYILADRSGSMAGLKWAKTCEALRAFVGALYDEDRVALTFFDDRFKDFAEAPLPVAKLWADPAFDSLVTRGTGGGTEILPAARHVFELMQRHAIPGRSARILIITDGQMGNESAVLAAFRPHVATPVFTIGIDTAVNDLFLRRLASQHGGLCRLLTPDDDINAALRVTVSSLTPALVDIRPRAPWRAASDQAGNLYQGETCEFFCETDDAGATVIEIEATNAAGECRVIPVQTEPSQNEAIVLLHARERILAAERAGDYGGACVISLRHNLLCATNVFVGWDEAEKVAVATQEVVQPDFFAGIMHSFEAPRLLGQCSIPRPEFDGSGLDARPLRDWLIARVTARAATSKDSAEEEPVDDMLYDFLFEIGRRFRGNAVFDQMYRELHLYFRFLKTDEQLRAMREIFKLCEKVGVPCLGDVQVLLQLCHSRSTRPMGENVVTNANLAEP